MKLKITIDTKKVYKICPKCKRLYEEDSNYFNQCVGTELIEIEFK